MQKEQSIVFENEDDIKAYVVANNNKLTYDALPICFDRKNYWKCYSTDFYGHGKGYCRYANECKLNEDKTLKRILNKTVNTLYDWRSMFVHNAEQPPIREKAILGGIYKKKQIITELTTTELKPLFEKMLKRFFDSHQMNS